MTANGKCIYFAVSYIFCLWDDVRDSSSSSDRWFLESFTDERKKDKRGAASLLNTPQRVCAQLVLVHGSPQKDIITQSRLCQDFIFRVHYHYNSLSWKSSSYEKPNKFSEMTWNGYIQLVLTRENNKRTSDTAVGGLSLVKDAAAVIIIYKEKGSLLKSRASISRSSRQNLNLLLFLMVYIYLGRNN